MTGGFEIAAVLPLIERRGSRDGGHRLPLQCGGAERAPTPPHGFPVVV